MLLVDQSVCRRVWYSDTFDWSFKGLDGRSRGLLCIWDPSLFSKGTVSEGDGFLLIEGCWGKDQIPCSLVNIYAPCTRTVRRKLFEELSALIQQKQGCRLIGGDFNVVKCRQERVGRHIDNRSMADFSDFISNLGLIDLQMGGRRYTWCNSNVNSIDRKSVV